MGLSDTKPERAMAMQVTEYQFSEQSIIIDLVKL